MTPNYTAPWHTASYARFLHERLPELLAARLPLTGYQVEETPNTACVIVALGADLTVSYTVPCPDAEGLFWPQDLPHTVVPLASSEYLDLAEIACVGEQLYDYLAERLGEAPANLPWTETLARTWLPLEEWVADFLRVNAQRLDTTNWLSRQTHLRRIYLPDRVQVITPGQFGHVCPFETPEGPNIGRVFSVAIGATIEDGRLVIIDDRPEATLGLTASMVPFLEHSDPNRLLMGVNMLRQWKPLPNPEPALVQTGNEVAVPEFWCGRNLLTAFTSGGGDTFEDSITLSASAAARLGYPTVAEVGDKLSNRHGTKGVVSRILPDDEMPHLPDGTPVELLYNFIALHTRLNFGQIREAVMGTLARAEGTPAVVPPFHAPSADALQQRLRAAGLPESGMITLTQGKHGAPLAMPTTVGWIYWGVTVHIVREKIHASVTAGTQRQGEMEYFALRDTGAYQLIHEFFNTLSAERPGAGEVAAQVSTGPVAPAPAPTPRFLNLQQRLAAGGVRLALRDGQLHAQFAEPEGEMLTLAHPLPHPWLRERTLTTVGACPAVPEYAALVEANTRLARLLTGMAPESLLTKARTHLADRLEAYVDALVMPEHLRLDGRVLFSGRTVITPGPELRIDQVGLADEIAWTLFGPLVAREVGGMPEVEARSEKAVQALDRLMARAWVVLNRAPTFMPSAFLAFHPMRIPGRVIRLHPLMVRLMNADFDGDQEAVFLPVTAEGQQDAGTRLTVAAHLHRDPALASWLYPHQEMLWAFARLSRTPEGREELAQLAGVEIATTDRIITRETLLAAFRTLLARDGEEATLAAMERLLQRGFAEAQASGASISPFLGHTLARPARPTEESLASWEHYLEEFTDYLGTDTRYDDPDLGPQLLAVKCGARGSLPQLSRLLTGWVCEDVHGKRVAIRHSFVEGLTPTEMFSTLVGAREVLHRTVLECTRMGYGLRETGQPAGFSLFLRAMRAAHPGITFAHAAAIGEIDPLTDLDSRLFVGLPVE